MNIKFRRLLAVLIAAVLVFAASAPALAANLGSLTLEITAEDDSPVADFEVRMARVAGTDGKLIGRFKRAGIDPDALKDETANAKNAKKLVAYANNSSSEKKVTDADGRVTFKNMSEGFYLVYDSGKGDYIFDPFLVVVPTMINGSAIYDIVSSPKVEENDPDDPDDPGGGGTTPTPTPTPGDDPDDPTPTPTPGGDPDDPDDPTPPPGGDPDDPDDPTPTPGGDPDDPDNPDPTPTPTPKPDVPVLPLTGVERRPIWVLLGLGGALIVAGILQLCIRRKAHE